MKGHVLAVVAALLVAGCLSAVPGPEGDAPTEDGERSPLGHFDAALLRPTRLCHDGVAPPPGHPTGPVCNFLMTTDPRRQGNEVTIAVNPTDPRNVVGGAKDYFPDDAGECVWDGVYVTKDGGRTYADRSFDGSPWRQLAGPDPSKANYATQFWCTTDPVARFDAKGNLYYLLMAYQADRVTGSKIGEDVLDPPCGFPCPHGALNDWAFNRAVQIVAVSSDGGASFHTFTPVLEGTFPVAFHDKGWIGISEAGTIHVGWLSFFAGNLYFRSTDGGGTYSDPVLMAPLVAGGGQGTMVEVGPAGEVYYIWSAQGGIVMRRSFDDGETWDEARVVVETTRSTPGEGLSARDRRGGMPWIAVDRNPDSPFAGTVYLVWQDGRDDGNDVYFAASSDQGETFGPAIRLNDDATGAAQYFPAISVSPGGVLDVSWMDTRQAPEAAGRASSEGAAADRIDQYFTYSLDGGATWSPNARVRDADDGGWEPSLSHHQNGMIFVGDYNDIASSWHAAHPVWPDTRDGATVNVYTATLLRPAFAVGWDAEKRAEAEAWMAANPPT